jgi:maltase-glucoamylase
MTAKDLGAASYILTWYKTIGDQTELNTFKVPFNPGFAEGLFDSQTVSLNATSTDDAKKVTYELWNLRNTYGLQMAQATHKAMTSDESPMGAKRPFIVSESTFGATSGKFGAHLAAPNMRTYEWMRYSVASTLQLNMFGIPMSGADVCGTTGTRDDTLCAYWYQLGAFYPVARNNYIKGEDGNNEATKILDTAALAITKNAMMDRLKIARYLYTKLFEASTKGGAVFKPMFFYYPEDSDAYFDHEQDFMVGDAIKVSPVLGEAAKKGDVYSYTSYFPTMENEAWVNIFDFSDTQKTTKDAMDATVKTNQRNTIKAADHANAYLRPGTILPMQSTSIMVEDPTTNAMVAKTAMTTQDMLTYAPVDLLVNLDHNGQAKGSLLLDDGESRHTLENQLYDYYQFAYNKGSLKREWATNDSGEGGFPDPDKEYGIESENRVLNKIVLVNAKDKTIDFACTADENQKTTTLKITKDADMQTVTLTKSSDNAADLKFYDITNVYFGDSKTDFNLCQVINRAWVTATGAVDLVDKQSVSFKLKPFLTTGDQTQILVTISILEPLANQKMGDLRIEMSNFRDIDPYVAYKPEGVISGARVVAKTGSLADRMIIMPGSTSTHFQMQVLSTKDGKTVVWDTNDHPIQLSEYLMTWGADLKTGVDTDFTGAFGLGERVDEFMIRDGVYSFWNRDSPNTEENGKLPGKNNYGTHPLIAWKSPVGTFVSTFLLNAAANDVIISNDMKQGLISMDQISVGGNFDLYISEGSNPEEVVKSYQNLVGKPVLVPEWLLGWNQCRYGYYDTAVLKEVVANYTAMGIPLDVMWNDIDYLSNYEDFTVDQKRYKDLGDFVTTTLHADNQHYIPIVDAAIAHRPD